MPMDTLFFNLAGFNIQINFIHKVGESWHVEYLRNKIHSELVVYLKGFIVFEKPKAIDITIEFTDGAFEKVLISKTNKKAYFPIFKLSKSQKIITYYQISLNQFQTVLRQTILTLFKKKSGFIIHSSSIVKNGYGYLFLGKSGAGKSTIVDLLNQKYQAFSDDMTIIRNIKNKYYIFQTPFAEKGWWIKKNTHRYELRRVMILHKSKDFKIKKIFNKPIISEILLTQIDAKNITDKKTIREALTFAKKFPSFYDIYFDRDRNRLEKLIESSRNN